MLPSPAIRYVNVGWELYLRALALAGRPVEATRAYDRYRQLLGEETGLLPGSNLTALHATIVAGGPVLQGADKGNAGQRLAESSQVGRLTNSTPAAETPSFGPAVVFGQTMAWVHAVRPPHFVGRRLEIGQLAATVGAVFARSIARCDRQRRTRSWQDRVGRRRRAAGR